MLDENNVMEKINEDVFVFPTSYQQRQLWFISRFNEDNVAYNIPFAYRVTGLFDINYFTKSLEEIIKRHEVFRTTFVMKNEKLLQIITSNSNPKLKYFDLSNEPYNEALLEKLLSEEKRKLFNLEEGPLLRFAIYKISEKVHVIQLTFHHIIIDHTSILLFARELEELYNSKIEDRSSNLKEVSLQYADFTIFELDENRKNSIDNKVNIWKKQLKDSAPLLDIPLNQARPNKQTFEGKEINFHIPQDFSEKIRELSKKEKKSLFMTFLSVFKILLKRYSNQNDIIIGCPFSNRIQPGTEDIMGCLMNTLPIRTLFSENDTFIDILNKVKDSTLIAQANQDVSFEEIVEVVQPRRINNVNPLYQVNFYFQDAPMEIKLIDAEVKSLNLHNDAAKFDLTLWMWDDENGFRGLLEYSTDLFSEKYINNLLENYYSLLESIIENPYRKINELNILNASNREEILFKRNNTYSLLNNENVVSLFKKVVENEPLKIAASFNNHRISYKKLNERSNNLAEYLLRKNYKENSLIGVYLNRSIEMLEVLLGIMKAGAAYIPLDPSFPLERISYMIADSGLKSIITSSEIKYSFPDNVDIIQYDKLPESGSSLSEINNIKENDLAYILYTSGSTGKPKGVKISHKSLANFLISMSKKPGISKHDKVLALTTLSFDIAGLELYLPIITGAKCVIVSKQDSLDGKKLKEIIREERITFMQATPATYRLLIEQNWTNESNVKMLIGGESVPMDLTKKLLHNGSELWNMYGPTETTIWSTTHRILPEERKIKIGKPIDNTAVYILDANLEPVPDCTSGEIYIGGIGLSSGYLGLDSLTNEKFIDNPFISGERIYKTGDLGRWLEDGNLEHLGRNDYQVKVRGFRIELEEIEKQLNYNPDILQSVVITRKDNSGENILIGFYISKNGKLPDLRSYLKSTLPDYMIPSIFTKVTTFPLTPNGKIDRKTLSEMEHEEEIKAPVVNTQTTQLEAYLKIIWENVLDRKNIDINDNFFDIGGHSLLAARLFSRIEDELKVKLPLAILFEASTIKDMASIIERDKFKDSWSSIIPILTKGNKPPLFLVHGAEGNILLYRNLAKYLGSEQPIYGIQSQGLDGLDNFNPNFEYVANHYLKEIKSIYPKGPFILGGYCLGGTIALEMAHQLKLHYNEEVAVLMLESYNIKANLAVIEFPYKYVHKIQNMLFHLNNLMLAKNGDKLKFIKQKADTSKFRFKIRVHNFLEIFNKSDLKTKYPHLQVQKINDEAQLKHNPKKYDGRVFLFKPYKDFIGLNDESYGWNNLLTNIKLVKLPLNPRGMLVEPFVQQTANEIRNIIDEISAS